jgi:hypothetical protein
MTRIPLIAALALAALVALPGVTSATTVTPTLVADNPKCSDLNPAWSSVKADPPNDGVYTDGTLSANVSKNAGAVDWSSNMPIDAVIIKGGDNANVYYYTPNASSDTGLVTPTNPSNGQPYGLSHVDFCYGPGGEPDPGTNPPPPDGGSSPTDTGAQLNVQGQSVAGATDPGGQLVLGERITPGTAKLLGARTGCASKAFSVRVRGSRIASVRMTLDGKRIKVKNRSARIDPSKLRIGVHRLVATVRFQKATRSKTKTFRVTFQRCARRAIAPKFTG